MHWFRRATIAVAVASIVGAICGYPWVRLFSGTCRVDDALDVFLIGLLGIPIVIAGLICFIVGVIVSIMWITAAMASLYHAVDLQHRASLQRPA